MGTGLGVLLLAAAVALQTGHVGGSSQEPPHHLRSLVVVTLDTVAAGRCSLYGYSRRTTPFLEELAARGAVFEHAYGPSNITGPSHASLFSGLDVVSHGLRMNGFVLAERAPWLPRSYSAAGGDTAAFVSAFPVSALFGFGRGFAVFDEPPAGPPEHGLPAPPEPRPGGVTLERALAWIAGHDRQRPFLLWVHFWDAHAPYDPPPETAAAFGDAPLDGVEAQIRDYDRSLLYVDGLVQRLFEALEERKLLDAADWVVCGDHGEAFFEHGLIGHSHYLHEEQVRVPLIVGGPEVVPGRVGAPVSLEDLAPTFAARLGVKLGPVTPTGRDLAPALAGRPGELGARPLLLARTFFTEREFQKLLAKGAEHGWDFSRSRLREYGHGPMFAWVDWPWKIILVRGTSRLPAEVYRLDQDPGEQRDLQQPDGGFQLPRLRALTRHLRTAAARALPSETASREAFQRLAELGYASDPGGNGAGEQP